MKLIISYCIALIGSIRAFAGCGALLLALSLLLSLSCHDEKDERPYGRFRRAREPVEHKAPAKDNRDELSALPYLQGYHPPKSKTSGVLKYDKDRAQPGLNLVVSAHASVVVIMDMQGKELHRWSKKFTEVWPGELPFKVRQLHKEYFRRAHLLDRGDLLAIYEGIGMIKLDKDSGLVWKSQCRAHHDLFVLEDGSIYTLTRKRVDAHERFKIDGPILEDFITLLGPGGEVIKSVSLLDCFLDSEYAPLLDRVPRKGDVFHTNTIEVLDRGTELLPMLRPGHLLISVYRMDAIAAVDLEEERVTWALTGMWKRQHDPYLLESGNMLVFDNKGHHTGSKVIEFNPLTQEIVWAYRDGPGHEFFSSSCGAVRRLPNGNTLIVESNYGRALEVTPQNDIVWEYQNPHRAGEDNELVATLMDVVRIPPGKIKCDREGCFK